MTGRVSLVVGGAGGIGRATTDLLVERGSRVVVLGLAGDALDGVRDEPDIEVVAGDAADAGAAEAAVQAAVRRWGRLDTVVCCAGTGTFDTVLDAPAEEWDRVVQANLMTTVAPVRAALPQLLEARGAVVIVSSVAGVVAVPGSATYSVTKHALIGLGRSLATDYAPLGVRTNVVCPGPVRTQMFEDVMARAAEALGIGIADAFERATSLNPRRELASPREIAQVIAFLGGPESAAVNGAVVMADGGVTAADLSMSALTGTSH